MDLVQSGVLAALIQSRDPRTMLVEEQVHSRRPEEGMEAIQEEVLSEVLLLEEVARVEVVLVLVLALAVMVAITVSFLPYPHLEMVNLRLHHLLVMVLLLSYLLVMAMLPSHLHLVAHLPRLYLFPTNPTILQHQFLPRTQRHPTLLQIHLLLLIFPDQEYLYRIHLKRIPHLHQLIHHPPPPRQARVHLELIHRYRLNHLDLDLDRTRHLELHQVEDLVRGAERMADQEVVLPKNRVVVRAVVQASTQSADPTL